ncbi:phosphatidylinositol-3-phosphatase myotubularin-1 isoform X5 [Andrographis paniculata]|uniref:phosphatidylinositol-3-phosphatase myotubularin-1 isoform X4 n=1 Tax=Andrographis paniculata TaxID=175694 RepID=UPI0021E82A3A|nr:phosphatidylinositol-3-phosphatase myotubularin-1 isoform X4 [Andrographis paniculata]XP_051116206.1 phosphatidylinositol-3-phosphatase myotubularin-1 isoform X5 [Andrographis paniculata]
MDLRRSRSGRTTLREWDVRLSESEKIEGTGSWDAIEWTKVDPVSRSIPSALQQFLIEAEQVIVEGHGVVLVNIDEAGTLFVTNFRLIFLVMKIPSGPRQVDRNPSQRLLQVTGKDMRIIVYGFRPRTKQRRAVYEALLRCTRLSRLWDLYAFSSGPSRFSNTNPKVRLLNEYFRLLGLGGSYSASSRTIEDGSFTLSNEWWRISSVNSNYTMCPTYPFALLVPNSISDVELQQACTFRGRCRLPVISWCHPGTGGVLARSSQPLVGLMMNMRSNADEKLVAALWTQLAGIKERRRKLYIADARPRKNAIANGAMGGGSESSANYSQSEIVFFGIDNIHAMRDSLTRLREYVDTHGANSSDGMSSFLRHGGWTWGGGNLSSMSASVSTLGATGWLIHVQSVLAGSAWIAARVALESAAVLVHCSDGWDRTTQVVALANLLLDPYYRTIRGFQALIEKDWLAFGHPFSVRMGMPTIPEDSPPVEFSRQASTGSMPSPPTRQSSQSASQPASSHAQNNCSPIFLQWVDCVSQLLRMYPYAFEFSSVFLVDLLDSVLSHRFGNFFCNSEKEREQAGVFDACGCLWMYLSDMRASEGRSHAHYNPFYDPSKSSGPLLPPAAALAPTLWPQFHLRWTCPIEAQAGEVEAHCRNMANKISELKKAKESAESKAEETTATMVSLTAELQNEKLSSSSAWDWARRARKETAAIKRAVQSLGCKVHFSEDGDCIVDVESNPTTEIPQKSLFSASETQSGGNLQVDEKSSLSLSQIEDDDFDHPITRVCESLCPLRTRDGGCRWPDAGCAQFGSQFVGLKANFDAFDRLSIHESYFGSQ